ncbi:MAG TPA: hypothetical protein VFD36_20510 [Kofleriaceae bacterium]|nr:hypothetical protein [Kofleriaceae bacterium]
MAPRLTMYVIYDRPHDSPGGFLVRTWTNVGTIIVPGKIVGEGLPTLDAARELVPPTHHNIGRQAGDDPKIVEVWI